MMTPFVKVLCLICILFGGLLYFSLASTRSSVASPEDDLSHIVDSSEASGVSSHDDVTDFIAGIARASTVGVGEDPAVSTSISRQHSVVVPSSGNSLPTSKEQQQQQQKVGIFGSFTASDLPPSLTEPMGAVHLNDTASTTGSSRKSSSDVLNAKCEVIAQRFPFPFRSAELMTMVGSTESSMARIDTEDADGQHNKKRENTTTHSSTEKSRSEDGEKESEKKPGTIEKSRMAKKAARRVAAVREFYKDILLIVMMSPSRYPLVQTVKKHYEKFFTHIVFCGPKNDSSHGVKIEGYDIVYGNEQYRAVASIIRRFELSPLSPTEEQIEDRKKDGEPIGCAARNLFQGYLYVADDLMLQPWSLLSRNRNVPWAAQMGIGNVKSFKVVSAVPGMSIQSKYRAQWPYWRKNRHKLEAAMKEGGEAMRNVLYYSAKMTHPAIYRWSKYRPSLLSDDDLHWSVFYTIVDTYYIPKRLALPYAKMCDLMAKHWIFGECAIATAIRSISPVYEEMDIQFYWSTLSAADCHRYKWTIEAGGIHRCRHDHFFAEALYSEETRLLLMDNATFRDEMLRRKK